MARTTTFINVGKIKVTVNALNEPSEAAVQRFNKGINKLATEMGAAERLAEIAVERAAKLAG